MARKSYKALPLVLMFVGGAIIGLLPLLLAGISKSWAVAILLAIATTIAATLSGNPKKILTLILTFALMVNVDLRFLENELRISFISLVILLLYVLWFIDLSIDKTQKIYLFPKTTAPAVAFLVAIALSIVVNMNGNPSQIMRMYDPIIFVMMYFYLTNNIKTLKDVKIIVIFLLLGAFMQAGLAMLELWTGIEIELQVQSDSKQVWQQLIGGVDRPRISGSMDSPNLFAIYLSINMILMILLNLCKIGGIWKFINYLGIGVNAYLLANTYSRGAWFVLGVSLLFTFFVYIRKIGNLKRVVLPTVIVAMLVIVSIIPLRMAISERLVLDQSTQVRIPLMEVAASITKARPFFGIGFRNYKQEMDKYDETGEGVTQRFRGPVHNYYLSIAAETGLLGFMVFMWLNLAVVMAGWQFLKAGISFLNNVGFAVCLSILMILAQGMVNPWGYRLEYYLIFFLLGLLVAIKKIVDEATSTPSEIEAGLIHDSREYIG